MVQDDSGDSHDHDGGVEQLDDGFVLDTGYNPDEFAPTPLPWYRSTTALTAIGAIGIAVVALTVSAVLLVTRPMVNSTDESIEPDAVTEEVASTTTALTTTALTTTPSTTAPESASEIVAPPAEPSVTEEPAYIPPEDVEESREEEEEAAEEAEESAEEAAEDAEDAEDARPSTGATRTNVTRSPATRTQISILPPG